MTNFGDRTIKKGISPFDLKARQYAGHRKVLSYVKDHVKMPKYKQQHADAQRHSHQLTEMQLKKKHHNRLKNGAKQPRHTTPLPPR